MTDEIFSHFTNFLSAASDEERLEIEKVLLSLIQTLQGLATYINILKTPDVPDKFCWVALSIIHRSISLLWEASDLDTRIAFVLEFNPLTFLDNSFFASVLDFLDDILCSSKNSFQTYHSLWAILLNQSHEIFPTLKDDNHIIKFLQTVQVLCKSLINSNALYENETCEFFFNFTHPFLELDLYSDNTKCQQLFLAFSITFELSFHSVFRKKCDVDDVTPSSLIDVRNACYENFTIFFSIFSSNENPTEPQLNLMEFIVYKLSSIAFDTEPDDETIEKELIISILDFIWPCFIIILEKSTSELIKCEYVQLMINLVDFFVPSAENLSILIQALEIKEEDNEKFLFEPIQFVDDNYYPTIDVTSSLRDLILRYLSNLSNYVSFEDINELLNSVGGSEQEMMFVSCFAKKSLQNEETTATLASYVTTVMSNISNTIEECTFLYLLSKCFQIFDLNFHNELISSVFLHLDGNSLVYASLFSKYLYKLVKKSYSEIIPVEIILKLLELYGGTVISTDLLTIFMKLFDKSEYFSEISPNLLRDIATYLPSVSIDTSDSSIEWTYTAIQCLTLIINKIGDISHPELVFHCFDTLLNDENENVRDLAVLATSCVSNNSPLSNQYFERIISAFENKESMKYYIDDFKEFFFTFILLYPENCQKIFDFFLNMLSNIELEDSTDIAACISVMALSMQVSGDFEISDSLLIVSNYLNDIDDTCLLYCINYFTASALINNRAGKYQMNELINSFLEAIVDHQIASLHNFYLFFDALQNLCLISQEIQTNFANIMEQMKQDPTSFIQLDADMMDTQKIMNYCIGTPQYHDE
ncbi:F-box domain containing protein [Trichomonas vaginalis G3]|uniref:F-box domain containing protein n=1 Tax=Trichomonas vaginalis (strain ATCC PRA-98 / G3) TaxID=412133 RepID=A2FER0_TRIV3|nr:armadillo (ARM) repeat-containing protein family [Trichomonas vaginalis G3]EAX96597.1 F-box domain containing protein [Trichomonas vaginalis G3]KAI5524096.1 armadillo (ARM) repeat-containing protein family [Trichomonas vaginalis G3]|eukprot:XP_001309527.1 F-box domain containing protein [Trichomonas vaginalis G3]